MKDHPSIPATMRALVLDQFEGPLRMEERPVPTPGPNEVLVKMAASPINPSDLSTIQGSYGQLRPLPFTPGLEGSGKVVAAGPGLFPRYLKGRRVACSAHPSGQGLWSEYVVTGAQLCIPLSKRLSYKQGAMLLVNPLTAWAFFAIAKQKNARAIVNTAAASALGRMIIRLGKKFNIQVINVVRRQEQVDLLRELGATFVLNSSEEGFHKALKSCCKEQQATLAFDAVAGEMTQMLMDAIPSGGEVVVYGALSEEESAADPRTLIFGQKRLSGFWLTDWLRHKTAVQILGISRNIQRNIKDNLQSPVAHILPLQEALKGPELYEQNMTAGKILIDMGNFDLDSVK